MVRDLSTGKMFNLKEVKIHWKDILIGVLVAYVVIDVLMGLTMKRKYPSLFEKFMEMVWNQNSIVVLLIGLLIGFAAWYFSSRSKECFKKEMK